MLKHIESLLNLESFSPPLNVNLSTLQRRFFKNTRIEGSCWIWTGTLNQRGYGVIVVGRTPIIASRASWLLRFGPVPTNLLVMHKCDNPPCVNPDHLMLGTTADNMADAAIKGRIHFKPKHQLTRAENNGRSKLTLQKVEIIRAKLKAGFGYNSLAFEFGVSSQSIWNIDNNKTWLTNGVSQQRNCFC